MTEEVVQVNIAGREYPLKIKANEITLIKKAEQSINECVKLYEKNFSVKDKQDLLAMCLVNFVTKLHESEDNSTQSQQFEKQLEDTEQYLTRYLNTLVL